MATASLYITQRLVYYTAHEKKDKAGLDEDVILQLLPKTCVVEHDHNTVNYNGDYEFQNAECCVHLLRDLQKVIDNFDHSWAKKMKELLDLKKDLKISLRVNG